MNEAIRSLLERYDCRTREDYLNALREILQELALLGLWRAGRCAGAGQRAGAAGYAASSMGLSVLVGPEVREIKARVSWGEYAFEGAGEEAEPAEIVAAEAEPADHGLPDIADDRAAYRAGEPAEGKRLLRGYRRIPRSEVVLVPLPGKRGKPVELAVPDSGGLRVAGGWQSVGNLVGGLVGNCPAFCTLFQGVSRK